MKKLLFVAVVLSLLSCKDIIKGFDDALSGNSNTRNFWAINTANASPSFYELQASRLVQNSRCEIWAEKGSGITDAQAKKIADEYSNGIYPKMMSNFGFIDESGNDVIDYAHLIATGKDQGGKLTILLLDIQDGYVEGSTDGTIVAGYFWPYDIFTNVPASSKTNKCAMLYIDINPRKPESDFFFETIAHEMQHLINFTNRIMVALNNKEKTLYPTDTWIDEGLSSAAEWVYSGKHLQYRLDNFNNDTTGLLKKGNNFFVWGNRSDEKSTAVLDDYSTAYLFFQWLRVQKSSDIYKKIISSNYYDYRAVTTEFGAVDWPSLLEKWLRANYDRSSSGEYGYGNDPTLNGIKRHFTPATSPQSAAVTLYPGEGVYSNASSFTVPSQSGNIKYLGLGSVSGSTINSGALLTYNVNTTVNTYDAEGNLLSGPSSESGKITGAAPPPNVNIIAPDSRSVSSGISSGPFPISVGDMLRIRGSGIERNFTGVNPGLLTGAGKEAEDE